MISIFGYSYPQIDIGDTSRNLQLEDGKGTISHVSEYVYYNIYHCVTIAYNIQYNNMLYRFVAYIQPLKMELTQGSETSANYNLTPGKYPKEYIQYSNHGESLKSSMLYRFVA